MEQDLLNYIKVSKAYEPKVIPEKNTFTFISNHTGIPQVWLYKDTNNYEKVGKYTDRILGVHHSPEGSYTLISMDTDGDEKQQFYLQKNDEDLSEILVCNLEYFHKFGGWNSDGDKICFSSNRREPGFFDIFVQDVLSKKTETVFQYDGICEPICWLNDGQRIVISVDETNIENTMYIIDLTTKEKRQIGCKDTLATYENLQLEQRSNQAYILSNEHENTMFLGKFNVDCPESIEKLYHLEQYDIEEIKISPDEQFIALLINEAGYSKLAIYDIFSQEVNYVHDQLNGVLHSLDWLNKYEVLFSVETPRVPGDIWSYNISKEKFTRLTYISENNDIEPTLIEPRLCHYSSFDKRDIPYFLYSRNDKMIKPAVIYVHGGPESQIRPTYNPIIQYLQKEGFAVATPNVRGSKGYGRNYIKLDDGRKRMDAVKDLIWLVEDLKISHDVNNKIGIIGRSYGGFMVLAAMTHYPEVWSAGVDIVGISNFKTFLQNTGAWRRSLRESEYGSLEDNYDFFDKIAPQHRTKDIKAPLLAFHGLNDTRVPVSEAEQLVDDMKQRGQSVELKVFEDEGHQTEKMANVITLNRDSILFFKEKLMK